MNRNCAFQVGYFFHNSWSANPDSLTVQILIFKGYLWIEGTFIARKEKFVLYIFKMVCSVILLLYQLIKRATKVIPLFSFFSSSVNSGMGLSVTPTLLHSSAIPALNISW